MKALSRAAAAAVTLIVLANPHAAVAQGQASDSYVLQPGQLRVQLGAAYSGYDERFGADGSEPLAAPLRQSLTAATFAPLLPLSTGLTAFLAATASQPGASAIAVDGTTLTLGTPDLELFESLVRAPIEISVGILPRVEVGVSVPVLRGEQMIQRFTIADGTVGANPNAEANAAVFAGIGAQWEALGRSPFLPTAGSALGTELQARVGALTDGGSLNLPTEPGDSSLIQDQLPSTFGVPGVRSRVDRYRLGDAQLLARVRLFSTFGDGPVPVDSARGTHLRSTLLLGLRLPTGAASDTVELLTYPYDIGYSGYSAGVLSDLFVGSRFWATMGVRIASFGGAEVTRLFAPPSVPLSVPGPPVGVRITPGSELEVRVAPRVRLVEGISLGAEYGWTRVGATKMEESAGSGSFQTAGGSGQRVGLGLRYSTLPAFAEGRSVVPMELELRYQRTTAGPEGAPDTGYAIFEARFLPRLWGR